jgi:hypothetical protein
VNHLSLPSISSFLHALQKSIIQNNRLAGERDEQPSEDDYSNGLIVFPRKKEEAIQKGISKRG